MIQEEKESEKFPFFSCQYQQKESKLFLCNPDHKKFNQKLLF